MNTKQTTRAKITRLILSNIERTRSLMEDGQLGHVFHTTDFTLFLCERDGILRLASPLCGEMVVSHDSETMQRHWNSRLSYDQIDAGCGVISTMRREALAGFIEIQQVLLDTTLKPTATEQA